MAVRFIGAALVPLVGELGFFNRRFRGAGLRASGFAARLTGRLIARFAGFLGGRFAFFAFAFVLRVGVPLRRQRNGQHRPAQVLLCGQVLHSFEQRIAACSNHGRGSDQVGQLLDFLPQGAANHGFLKIVGSGLFLVG